MEKKLPVKNIFLTGFMCSGKTETAGVLAKKLGAGFIDLDAEIEKETGETVSGYISKYGIESFRQVEDKVFKRISAKSGNIISFGGGFDFSRDIMLYFVRDSLIVYLSCEKNELVGRLKENKHRLPLFSSIEDILTKFEKLFAQREPFYLLSDFTVDTTGITPARTAEKIMAELPENKSEIFL